ncbi:MAG: hypothetical protein HXX10_19650 [Rhodoplanes sp.]|uniref:hypothetical protein n=1 Tax=Rhodoplanes sp. TaxID=1968906 RepID=UPI0018467C48|nr:hypothetical protein [Rhodoplanes sp.]NVO16253.1 hypothetical protein [Rhodoplanes sp.]
MTLGTENPRRYEDLLSRVGAAVGADDIIDWVLVKDIVNIIWEIQRFRRAQASTIKIGCRQAMEETLAHCLPYERSWAGIKDEARLLAQRWFGGDKEATQKVESVLAGAGLSMADITSQAMTCRAVELDRIADQIERCETRREKSLQQIERHHTGWGKRARRAAAEAVDAEFREVPPNALNSPTNGASERPS